MKKIISLILTTFTVAILFAAARPSLDGRAVVSEEGEMPKGLFARTIGYLPGDSVTVTNPANGSAVDVLILGSIDASEGVAILLSPEAADRLGIRKDSNVQVKITKRTGSLDETVSGTAVLADEEDNSDYSDGTVTEDNDIDFETEESNSVETDGTEDTAVSPENDSTLDETPTEMGDESVVTNISADEIPSADEADDLSDNELVEQTPENTEDTENIDSEKIDEDALPPADEVDSEKIVDEEPSDSEIDEGEVFTDEIPEESVGSELIEDSDLTDEQDVPSEVVEDSSPVDSEIPAPVNVVIPDEFDSEEMNSEETKVDEVPEDLQENEETVESDENSSDEYAPIILVPSEPNPPEESEESPSLVETEEETDQKVDEIVITEPSAPTANTVTVESSVVEDAISIDKYLKSSLKELESGKYYVQIASLSKKENIESLLNNYAKKYPIVLVPLSNGSGYQVLVGPLTADEYGMIMERFRAYGFKDCFLRKIK